MPNNHNPAAAKKNANDEFYTLANDISLELAGRYDKHFKGASVLCNCDDPYESNFFLYFAQRFESLGLKRLVATCYAGSPVAKYRDGSARPYKAVMDHVTKAPDGSFGPDAVRAMMDSGEIEVTELEGDGSFDSPECLELLDECDIVVTNPPWSRFRDFVALLMEHDKKFAIIGNKNAITYKEIFPLLKDDKVWLGYTSPKEFMTPNGMTKKVNGLGRWWTNLDIKKRHEPLDLWRRYYDDPSLYPKYDNYDAIEVPKVSLIPCDYEGVMGVPVTIFSTYSPEQLEIVGMDLNSMVDELGVGPIGDRWINAYRAQGGRGHITANMHSLVYFDSNGKAVSPYRRVLVRLRNPKPRND